MRRWRDCSAAKDVGLLDDGMAEAGAHCGDWVKAAQAIPDLFARLSPCIGRLGFLFPRAGG